MITVVLPFKNRDEKRLENCLYTLSKQSLVPTVLVVDYGSDTESLRGVRRVCNQYSCVKLHAITIDGWKKTHANNVGLRQVTTKYVLFTDADMVYRPNFIEEAVKTLELGNVIATCQCQYLSRNETRGLVMPIDWKNYNPIIDQTSGPTAVGACLGVETEWAKSVGGFDEEYNGWGREDYDFLQRALLAKKNHIWLNPKTGFYHQWHVASDWKKDQAAIVANTRHFDEFTEKRKLIVRNPKGWGLV